jgi:hypothetical protein
MASDSRALIHPPAVKRACILRVLVGAQAAPASHASSRRALSPSIVRVEEISPCHRCHRAPATTCCAVQAAVTAQAPRILRAPRVGAETLCANLMPVIDPVPQVCVLQQACALTPCQASATPAPSPRPTSVHELRRRHPLAAPRPAQQHSDLPDALHAATSMARSPDAARRSAICCCGRYSRCPAPNWHGAIGTWDENYSKHAAADTSERHRVWRESRDVTNQPTPVPDSLRRSARERHTQTQHGPSI